MVRRTTTLRKQILALALATTLPLLIFSLAAALWTAYEHRAAARQGLENTTRALSLALDEQIETWKAALLAFATSAPLDEHDAATLYRQAEITARRYGGWIAISLPSGQQILNTLTPPGAPLPRSHPVTLPPHVPPEGVVHDLFQGPAADRPILGVTVPALRNGVVTHYVHFGVSAEQLTEILAREGLPEGWAAALVDSQNRVVTRVPEADWPVGAPASSWYAQGSAGAQSGFLTGQMPNGTEVLISFERLASAPWTVAVTVPRAELDRAWQRPLILLAGGGALLVAAIAGVFLLLGSRLTRPMDGLAAAARAVTHGAPLPPVPTSNIREIVSLRNAVIELSQKQILLREVNHRIKNSLQLVSSLLGAQSRAASGDETQDQFRQAQVQIRAIARLHERLYKADQYEAVDAFALVHAVCEDIAAISAGRAELRVEAVGEAQIAPETAGPFALIVAELVMNAVKHAATSEHAGLVDIRCRVGLEERSVISVVVLDNGRGLPPGFDLAAQNGLGLRMCLMLALQIGGSLRAVPSSAGATFELRLPALAASP